MITVKTRKIKKAFKFRLSLTRPQQRTLRCWGGCTRKIFNWALSERELAYKTEGKSLNYYDQAKELTKFKKTEGLEYLREVPSQSLQVSLKNLDDGYKRFFKGLADKPRFKKKGRSSDTISFPQGELIEIQEHSSKKSKIKLPKLGWVKFIHHRKFDGKIRQATISAEGGNFNISILVETEIEDLYPSRGPVGLDLGVTRSITPSEGKYSNLPVSKIKELESRIKSLQKRRSGREKSSPGWVRLLRSERKLQRKITNIRKDFLHKQSFRFASKYEIVCIEDLDVSQMTQSASGTLEAPGLNVQKQANFNRASLRQGWYTFRTMLEYKCDWYGSRLVLVDPAWTSQKCSGCGFTNKANRKTQAEFSCFVCDLEINADLNAAINIRRLGLESLVSAGDLPRTYLDAPTIAAGAA